MRFKIWWLAVLVIVALILAESGVAQPPGQQGKGGPPDKFGKKDGFGKGKKGGGLTEEDVVDRIMSFDKTNSGKITKEDLPERLQYLIEKGDTNKDGVLDRDEVKALAAKIAKDGPFDGFGGFGGKGPGGKGGKGKGDFFGKGGPGGPGAVVDQRLADLEERLETMLKEVKDLREMLATKGPKGPKGFKGPPKDGGFDSGPNK